MRKFGIVSHRFFLKYAYMKRKRFAIIKKYKMGREKNIMRKLQF